jgi:hypothetical protein
MDQQISSELPPLHGPEQGMQAPQNPFEALAAPAQTEAQQGRQIERGISQAPPAPLPPLPIQPPTATSSPVPQSAAGMPTIADDTDLIEKEWVVKAKEIVERTKHDPYQQNKEVERVKADYLKKRYNKDIKVTED